MTQVKQQRPRQVPLKKVLPATATTEPTQVEALLRDAALVLALTQRVKAEILAGR
jgi:hypothetical protein